MTKTITTMAALLALGSGLLTAGTLSAQAPPADDDELDAESDMMPEPEPPPPVVQPPPPPPPPPPPAPVVEEPADEDGIDWLPDDRIRSSFGLGFGWSFPGTEVWIPSTVTARFRFDSGFTIEPSITFRVSGTNGDLVTESRDLTINVGTGLRVPLASAGPVDFLFLGGVSVGFSVDLEPGDTKSLSVGASYGLGMEVWLAKRWSVSLDTTNDLLSIGWSAQEVVDPFTGMTETQSATSWSAGLVWNPRLRVIMTAYF